MLFISGKYILAKGFRGLALFPFIFIKRDSLRQDKVFVNHERIHLQQQKELLLLAFLLWYGLEYFIKLLHYRNRREAYLNISFEREAYQNEKNLNYLSNQRKLWAFTKYL
ncbi:hypothetical protein LX95_01177 [Mesonia algae]|uniref:Peptidase M56 domain-containing protein n=1 Tax=Mesonia algae TaxID=213248 RepID=A0A2W7I5I3_9FLAO|nr:hypothetical protein [Mesonia algae]PZW41498.1 hypothetical protein LX95_01177 [Mesonia algae]